MNTQARALHARSGGAAERGPELPPLARFPVFAAMGALGVFLTVASAAYGYHRDELYFRMLPPAWGYVDQPPLTPLLVRLFSFLVADEVWAIRIPATLAAVASVLVVVLITRELGGGRAAQGLCAWAYAFATAPLLFGHVMLTATLDLVFWPAVVLLMMRAVLREQPAWWLAAGAVVGLAMYNKLLIAGLLVSLAAGLLLAGPRKVFRSGWVWGAAVLALAIGSPNLFYQAANGWPQLEMGAALAENNAAETRVLMWPFLFLTLGPPLAVVWAAGAVALLRRPQWRTVRFTAAALPVLLTLTFLAGGQIYYPSGLLTVLFAAGCVPTAAFVAARVRRRALAAGAVALNAAVAAVISLPVLPVPALAASPVPDINQVAADQVGWPVYVEQVAAAYRSLPGKDAEGAVLIASNYGEAGALARYGPALGLPPAYSGHNELQFRSRPPDTGGAVIVVGGQASLARTLLEGCRRAGVLDNGVGVDNEEQGQEILVCSSPAAGWRELWPAFAHYD
ncbi:glycosyltransferase family 39 protein [Arthrobacter sp. MSA 4-2]|uniref:glycosyltransferase family 39 protein n=1 Tax=Arthrobacter sp. MSA 4-2 TaxID=2794349 RepID=UPI0018E70B78|nr:glycosyltransferase family 39 protein [Arthrobacter sp. MSA 4-2]MBJ2120831.1 glycosyltransferase family 39 protein [Arthrobacter sp. MSA 4-2]